MNRKEFGKLVVTLRTERPDQDNKIWTRADLAEKTGLGELILGKIERGVKATLEPNTLLKLASAFQLTSRERKEFFAAAIRLDDKNIPRENSDSIFTLNQLLQMLRQVQLPSFILDGYSDVIAANHSILRLLNIPTDLIENAANVRAGFNQMRVVFAPESGFRELMGEQWHEYATRNMLFFRAASLRYRATPYFANILKGLREYEEFDWYWRRRTYEKDDYYIDSELVKYCHPELGNISYFSASFIAITMAGDLHFTTYIPASAETSKVFSALVMTAGTDVQLFASWPEKPHQFSETEEK
jgi:transcriptional regulator with XRE-family HTH domain